jgi:Winged helix DNA-binding domain
MGEALADGADLAPAPRGLTTARTAVLDRVTAERLHAQLLCGRPASTPEEVAERLLAIQAQDGRGARLAIRARSRGLSTADVDTALGERRLVVDWLNRGTLHMVRSEDHAWLHALTAPRLLAGNAHRLAQEGVAPSAADRAIVTIERSLAEEGPLTRHELRSRIAARGVRTEGQALIHLLLLACLRGVALRGPMKGREQAYALVHDWLGDPPSVDRDVALAELARRYLDGHGPASDRDLARWSGLALGDARSGLQAVAGELRQRSDGLLDLSRRRRAATLPPPRLLGAFEPVLLGWSSRKEILGERAERVVTGGLFRPFAMVDGVAAGVWSVKGREIQAEDFRRLSREETSALSAEGESVRAFLGIDVPASPRRSAPGAPR